MIERTGPMAFAAGALVFPGGRIDKDDRSSAEGIAAFPDAAARIAAIRETIEETGIAPATAPQPAPEAQRLAMALGDRAAPALFDRLLAKTGSRSR